MPLNFYKIRLLTDSSFQFFKKLSGMFSTDSILNSTLQIIIYSAKQCLGSHMHNLLSMVLGAHTLLWFLYVI